MRKHSEYTPKGKSQEKYNTDAVPNKWQLTFNHKYSAKPSENDHRILYCFRKSPSFNTFQYQQQYIRKILGLIAYRKDFLMELTQMEPTPIEQIESIEQMRIIEKGYAMHSIHFELSQPSINEPDEVTDVWNYLKKNQEQQDLLQKVLNFEFT